MIDDLARCPDPSATHADLRDRGAHRLPDGRWVVATAADVSAVLCAPQAGIGFAADPDRPVTALQARMARFTDGAEHAPRRTAVERLLAGIDPVQLRRAAAGATAARIAGRTALDVMAELARAVPVAVLAAALGVADPAAAVDATVDLARAIAPPLDAAPPPHADAAVATLTGVLPPSGEDVPVAALSLLFQAADATAGLIGNAAARLGHPDSPQDADALIADTLRRDGPVQLTTRLTSGPLELGDRTVPAGRRIVVVLAAADGEAFGFGHGPHACPGARHATALAAGVLDALMAAGARAEPGPVAREPRPNLRIPTRVPVRLPPIR